jgi:hypothetical protein
VFSVCNVAGFPRNYSRSRRQKDTFEHTYPIMQALLDSVWSLGPWPTEQVVDVLHACVCLPHTSHTLITSTTVAGVGCSCTIADFIKTATVYFAHSLSNVPLLLVRKANMKSFDPVEFQQLKCGGRFSDNASGTVRYHLTTAAHAVLLQLWGTCTNSDPLFSYDSLVEVMLRPIHVGSRRPVVDRIPIMIQLQLIKAPFLFFLGTPFARVFLSMLALHIFPTSTVRTRSTYPPRIPPFSTQSGAGRVLRLPSADQKSQYTKSRPVPQWRTVYSVEKA